MFYRFTGLQRFISKRKDATAQSRNVLQLFAPLRRSVFAFK